MSYMTSASLPRQSSTGPLPTLCVNLPMMQTQDGSMALYPLKTKKPEPTNYETLFYHGSTPAHQQRYFVKKPSSAVAPSRGLKDKDTRSKARPGFRKGKWTDEESKYAEQMAYYFKEGLLPLEKGTMLRMYLAEKLNCEPMRITKKFTGDECIGKQIFRPLPPSPMVDQRIQDALVDLEHLEKAFLERIEEMPMYCMSTKKVEKPTAKRPKKPKTDDVQPPAPAQDAQAASLLLGFFNHAHDVKKPVESPQHIQYTEAPVISPKPEGGNGYRKRKYSISHCVAEYEEYLKRPRIDSFSLVTSN
ncbi:Aste57867_1516 [Aphanomyces stellatus]|uniref:Aste57867_1516 protein n=1 Tax=Aphanomyces stellatus TaxID=120398 RepID=A0A485K8T8_9STRA|nr:hypothetical protein As57867_001515 [Aphanomyces stellatus]VFT78732.1 Aste57867_1516 [Aphanomyces stellatus]